MVTLMDLSAEDRHAVRQVIRTARAKIAEGWTQNAFARAKVSRLSCKADSENAGCWCILGALAAAVGVPDVSYFQPDSHRTRPAWLAEGLLELKAGEPLPEWNDAEDRTIEQVLGLLDAVAADLDTLQVAA
jgi:hypothetical protein